MPLISIWCLSLVVAFRVRLMHYADTLEAKGIVLQSEPLCKEDPVAWKVGRPLLRHGAEADSCIADFVPTKSG